MPDNVVLMYSCQWSGVFLFLFFGGGAQTAGTTPSSNIFTVGRLQATTLFNYIHCHLSLPSHQQHRLSHAVDLEHHLPAVTSIRIIIATQVGHHHPIVMCLPCSPHVQDPTVISSTILDLASFIICHHFTTSPLWCTHLARHVGATTAQCGYSAEAI